MTAQFEEVVVATDLLDLEHLGPDSCQGDFHLAARRLVDALYPRARVRGRQGLAVRLAVGGQRQGLEMDKGGGQHIARQVFQQMGAQGLDGLALLGGVVGHQARIARLVLADHDHGILECGMCA